MVQTAEIGEEDGEVAVGEKNNTRNGKKAEKCCVLQAKWRREEGRGEASDVGWLSPTVMLEEEVGVKWDDGSRCQSQCRSNRAGDVG